MRIVPVLLTAIVAVSAHAGPGTPVDLSGWTAESYPAVSGFPAGNWVVAPDNLSVTQQNNGQPTVFHSAINAFGNDLNGTITVNGGDDDYAGFVLGFAPNDSTNPNADFLLVDWKSRSQSFNFGGPAGITPGSTAFRGLAVSRVSGLPTADEFWGHVDFAENPAGGVTELARAATLGDTGWVSTQTYEFTFEFSPNRLTIFVDGTMEFDLTPATPFTNGRWGFYNFSQGNVTYSGFTTSEADSDQDGIGDNSDNCQFVANADQRDTDGDSIGNICDPDIAPSPNDCQVNFLDLNALKISLFATPDVGIWNPDADFNGDDIINFLDLEVMKRYFFGLPGPSGLTDLCDQI